VSSLLLWLTWFWFKNRFTNRLLTNHKGRMMKEEWRLTCDWTLLNWTLECESESYAMTDGQSASLSWIKTHLRLTTRFLLLSDSCGCVDVGRSLWRQDRPVVYNCCWSSPAQSFLGPSTVGLVTIFYSLRFETSCYNFEKNRIWIAISDIFSVVISVLFVATKYVSISSQCFYSYKRIRCRGYAL
jgi:hypothetical protein